MRRTLKLHALALCSALALSAVSVLAQDEATKNIARELARDGQTAFDAGRFADAADRFGRAYDLVSAPTLGVQKARALARLGRLVEAAEAYEQVLRRQLPEGNKELFEKSLSEAKRELDTLRPRVPRLKLSLEGVAAGASGVAVTLSGKPMAVALLGIEQPVDPGTIVVEVEAPGMRPARRELVAKEGEKLAETIVLEVDPDAPSEPIPEPTPTGQPSPPPSSGPDVAVSTGSSQRTWGWVSLGVGAVGLGVGAVSGMSALSAKSTLDDACKPECPRANADDLDRYRSMRTISWIGFGVGAIGVGAGITLLATAPKKQQAHITPFIGPMAAGVRGAF